MDIKGKMLRPNRKLPSQPMGTGRVREYCLGRKRRMFQITTFCPDLIGPGPTHLYLIEDDALILIDTGMPTDLAKNMFYYWRNQRIPADVEALADDHSERELLSAIELRSSLRGTTSRISISSCSRMAIPITTCSATSS